MFSNAGKFCVIFHDVTFFSMSIQDKLMQYSAFTIKQKMGFLNAAAIFVCV